jgi:hypothetical protein
MTDLVAWLRAQIDHDERVAKECLGINALVDWKHGTEPARWKFDDMSVRDDSEEAIVRVGHTWPMEGRHIALHDPARVLRQVEAYRELLEKYDRVWESRREHPDDLATAGSVLAWEGVVRTLASVFSDRPGYTEAVGE